MSTVNVNRVVDSSGGVLAPISSVMRNRIINGDMRIDQRNAGASVTPTNGAYTLDRWQSLALQSNKYSVQQNSGAVTAPAGFNNYLGVVSLSAYSSLSTDYFFQVQPIEGFNFQDLSWGSANAKTVTLSFWVRSSLTGTFSGSLQNSAENRSYAFTYSIPVANTWTQISVTIAGDTTGTWVIGNGIGCRVNFNLGSGANFLGTAGAWGATNLKGATGSVSVVGTNGATFYITGVQLEVGTQATSFEYRQYQQELALCQRYFNLLSNGNTGAFARLGYNSAGGQQDQVSYTFPIMRVTPTIGGSPSFSLANCSTPSISATNSNSLYFVTTLSDGGSFQYSINGGQFNLSAEL
jgi:hypothetical protein